MCEKDGEKWRREGEERAGSGPRRGYTALGLLMSRKSLDCGWNLEKVASWREAFSTVTMSPSWICSWFIIWERGAGGREGGREGGEGGREGEEGGRKEEREE